MADRPARPTVPRSATQTLRAAMRARLADTPMDFDDLRREFQLGRADLESELAHLERSVRSDGSILVVEPPECRACGYVFEPRKKRPFHAPRRCPECKEERVQPPQFSIRSDREP